MATRTKKPLAKPPAKPLAKPAALENQPPRADGTPEGINLSQLMEWMRCRYRWELKNRRHVQKRSIQPYLDRGSAVHAGIAAGVRKFASATSPVLTPKRLEAIRGAVTVGVNGWIAEWAQERGDSLQPEETQELEATADEGFRIAWKAISDADLQRFETVRLKGELLIEQKLFCDFLPGIPFYGTPDWVVKDRQSGGVFPIDFKVRETLQSPEHEEVDLQLPAYQYMLLKNGIGTSGAIKWQIRAGLPREPQLNRNGKMSVQRIATTWEVYKAALIRNGLDPLEYGSMEQKLDTEFFRVDRIYRNLFAISSIWDNIIVPMGRLFAQSKTQVRHMHYFNCNGCWAREFCLAELRGEDTDFLLETIYVDTESPKAKIAMRPEDFIFVED